MDKNFVKLDFYNSEGIVGSRSIGIYDWYDGEIEEIDNDEYRILKGIFRIDGYQIGQDGSIETSWITNFDKQGRLIESKRFDKNHGLIEHEEFYYDVEGKLRVNKMI